MCWTCVLILLRQQAIFIWADFWEERVALKLLLDLRDKQSPGPWALHQLLRRTKQPKHKVKKRRSVSAGVCVTSEDSEVHQRPGAATRISIKINNSNLFKYYYLPFAKHNNVAPRVFSMWYLVEWTASYNPDLVSLVCQHCVNQPEGWAEVRRQVVCSCRGLSGGKVTSQCGGCAVFKAQCYFILAPKGPAQRFVSSVWLQIVKSYFLPFL